MRRGTAASLVAVDLLPWCSSGQRHVLGRRRTDVAGRRTDQAVVRGLLRDVCTPSHEATESERGGGHRPGDPARVHDDPGVELPRSTGQDVYV